MNARNTRSPRNTSLRSYYTINFEIGLIVTLSLLIAAFRMPVQTKSDMEINMDQQEVVSIEEIVQTKQETHAPAPPRPVVPVEVPNSEVFEEEVILFDSELDLGEELSMPTTPPPAPEDDMEEEHEVFIVVERMPELKGGMQAVMSKIEYPQLALKAGIEGRVIVQFVVNEKGQVVNPKVIRGIGGGCDEEALRVARQLDFTPGMQSGHPVKVQFTLPVIFKINRNS
jgi:protein TonB